MNQTTKRLIWQRPKKLKRYTVYAIAFHLVLIAVIVFFIVRAYQKHNDHPMIDASVISSIPQPASTKANPSNKQKSSKHNMQPLEQQMLSHQLQQESKQLNQASSQLHQENIARMRLIDHYKNLILQQIASHWVVPKHTNHQASCVISVQLSSYGEVIAAHLVRSSGDPALDKSALRAVQQASPLPVPKNQQDFNLFKQLRLTLRPEKIVHV